MKDLFTDKRANDVVSGGGNSVFAAAAGEGPGPELAGVESGSSENRADERKPLAGTPKPETDTMTAQPRTPNGVLDDVSSTGKSLMEYRHNL
jgi:hypothetical protein